MKNRHSQKSKTNGDSFFRYSSGEGVTSTIASGVKNLVGSNRRQTSTLYPNCTVNTSQFLGDGKCDNYKETGDFNSIECGFDAGDCIEFNQNYPNCTAYLPDMVLGNGWCSVDYNTEECGYDGGDCIEFNEKYPNCTAPYFYPELIGNGRCDDYEPYNTNECGFDEGDCLNECSGLTCYSTEVKAGIGIAVVLTGLGLCYFSSRRCQQSKVDNGASSAEADTPETPLPQQYPNKKYHSPGGNEWHSTFAVF
ncbi:hypothetical protein CTEN210_00858 [Chaetoceros tenuissimus]|uniref:LNR domain-containing protein n=1 Tax=Chaetoceros tenuissimus TaxID=426638 RepID=A0AAD3CGC4_9STRA|nr:hypothetical protein CTEN210_00858 [Chaetoceros tenuissimus]